MFNSPRPGKSFKKFPKLQYPGTLFPSEARELNLYQIVTSVFHYFFYIFAMMNWGTKKQSTVSP